MNTNTDTTGETTMKLTDPTPRHPRPNSTAGQLVAGDRVVRLDATWAADLSNGRKTDVIDRSEWIVIAVEPIAADDGYWRLTGADPTQARVEVRCANIQSVIKSVAGGRRVACRSLCLLVDLPLTVYPGLDEQTAAELAQR